MELTTIHLFCLAGIVGGLFTAAGDVLLDLKGPKNEKLGQLQLIDSAWQKMSIHRFTFSILLALFGTPLIFLGMTAMAHELWLEAPVYGRIFWLISVVGCSGAFFIHAIICLFPVIFKTMQKAGHSFEQTERVINAVYYAVRIPFWVQYMMLTVLPSLMLIYALYAGILSLSMWYVLLTFPCLFALGALLYIVKFQWFCDLPFCVMPSLSMSCIGLLALLNHLL